MNRNEAAMFGALLAARKAKREEPVFVGVDLGNGPDRTFVTEFVRDPNGTIHVLSVSDLGDCSCPNSYTGGQDF